MKFRPGAVCPIAALAGKTTCLRAVCPWHRPNTESGCLITELGEIVEIARKAAENVEYIVNAIGEENKSQEGLDVPP